MTNHHAQVGPMVIAKIEKNEKIMRKVLAHDHPLERLLLPYNGTGWRVCFLVLLFLIFFWVNKYLLSCVCVCLCVLLFVCLQW